MSIWFWTDRNWSEKQADSYLRELHNEFAVLAADERRGRKIEEIRSGYWQQRVRSHVIFFLRDTGGIEIVRVLHQNMDFAAHLKDEP